MVASRNNKPQKPATIQSLALFWYIIGTVHMLEIHHNVIFQKVNEIKTTKSHWNVERLSSQGIKLFTTGHRKQRK